MSEKIDIKLASTMLGVSMQTLRRWDSSKRLISRRDGEGGHRYYFKFDLEDFLFSNYTYLHKVASSWVFSSRIINSPFRFYCEDAYIFKARLSKFERVLQDDKSIGDDFSLIVSSVGEIGNNAFDHNIGKWPDIPGLFFAYNLKERKVILGDRGQGVLATLRKVKPSLTNDKDALKTAFNEVISGRYPENRGNGLKYVKKIIQETSLTLAFHSGNNIIKIKKKRKPSIKKANENLRGCFIILGY